MTGPFWKHLTNSYVKARGMEPFMMERPAPVAAWIPEYATFPVSMHAFDRVVVYNHGLYVQSPDGLSWDLKR